MINFVFLMKILLQCELGKSFYYYDKKKKLNQYHTIGEKIRCFLLTLHLCSLINNECHEFKQIIPKH